MISVSPLANIFPVLAPGHVAVTLSPEREQCLLMDNLQTNEAHDNYTNIVILRKSINTNFWQLVERLKTAKDNRQWAVLDYDSWASYLAQPEIDLNEHTVEDFIYILENISKAIKNTGRPEQMIPFDIDISKLKAIAPHITSENAEELLTKAKTLSRSDLRNEIRELSAPTKIPVLPEGKYNVIYADPPWCYGDKHDYNGTTGAETYYPSLTISELCQIKIPTSDNAVLFLWVTSPLLDECMPVIKAWGFEYKTSFVWDKVKHNMGHYNSVRHEFLLVCTKGSFIPENKVLFDSVITQERSDIHSQKPEKFYEIIETLYPNGKYLELFARNTREGWISWGNEV